MRNEGKLYVVATPIGNLQDITLRAIETLKNVHTVVCEDTRVTSILLSKHNIKKPLIAINEFNEEQMIYQIIKLLETSDVALVSDAGTPLISDPGYRLVTAARSKEIKVIPIPGASAVVTALSASSLPTDKFIFLGFLPKSKAKAAKALTEVKSLKTTVVLYESPHRITACMENILEVFGDIEITIARELTKVYEEITTKKASEFIALYKDREPKGEIVVLFSTKS